MTNIDFITLETADPRAAADFYETAFGLREVLRFRESESATTGFRGFTLSTVVSQPSTVRALFDSAVEAGATVLKPVAKSLWGVGGIVQAPDGAIWNVATSARKDTGPATRQIDEVVLLLGATDVGASKKFYAAHGFPVGKSLGGYVQFDLPGSPIGLGLYARRALAKSAGVDPAGSGSHRLTVGSSAGAFTDPDGFVWAAATD